MPRILLVAPDSDLSRSLQFALRAEGHDVVWCTDIAEAGDPAAYGCTVLDHHATGPDIAAATRFCSAFAPVILLANQRQHELSPAAFRTLMKPLLGRALTAAVDDAMLLWAATK